MLNRQKIIVHFQVKSPRHLILIFVHLQRSLPKRTLGQFSTTDKSPGTEQISIHVIHILKEPPRIGQDSLQEQTSIPWYVNRCDKLSISCVSRNCVINIVINILITITALLNGWWDYRNTAHQFWLFSNTNCYAELIDPKIKIDSLTNFWDIFHFVYFPCNSIPVIVVVLLWIY